MEAGKPTLKLVRVDLMNDTAARLALENVGQWHQLLYRYAIGSTGQHFFAPPKLIDAGQMGAIRIMADPGSKFENGKWSDIQVWSDRGELFFYLVRF